MYRNVLFLCFLTPLASALIDPLVTLPNGRIRGKENQTPGKKTFYAFERIPYAVPPIGNLRFQPPLPAQNWSGILNTTENHVTCFQVYFNHENEHEDCLYLNVFTPNLPGVSHPNSTALFPVMFFIHGGGFENLDGSRYTWGPEYLLEQDVIMVSTNYRLGPFGFLSTQDEVIPGNMGLKDQQLALKWTQDNIKNFGGDPSKVTIFGQSAGSASVAYHLLSSGSQGLFQGAIAQSGSFLSPWAFQRNSKRIAFTTAGYLNSTFNTNRDSKELLKFLQQVPARDLDKATERYRSTESIGTQELYQGFFWAPVLEPRNPTAFLTLPMYGLLKAGNIVKVPLMIGMTSEEMLMDSQDTNYLTSRLKNYDQHPEFLVPDDMKITSLANLTKMGRNIQQIYTNGEPFANHLGDGVRYFSDMALTRSVIRHAEMASKFSKVYLYQFSYHGPMAGDGRLYNGSDTVSHGADVNYIFYNGMSADLGKYPKADQTVHNRMVKLWTDFAKYQNPTPKTDDLLQNLTWPAVDVSKGNLYYMDINADLTVKNHPKNQTYGKWVELYNTLGYDNFDTY